MSDAQSGKADAEARTGFKSAVIGALGGTFIGIAVSGASIVTSGVSITNLVSQAVITPFTGLMLVFGLALGYLEAVA